MTVPSDPRSLDERAAWDAVAPSWNRWWSVFETAARPVTDRLVSLAGIAAGGSVLDVATGLGEPALTAARAVGPRGRVVATDLSPGMLAFARERARERGLRNVELVECDATTLDRDERHDAALCRFGLMLFPDPVAVARRVRDHLRPGAKFAAAVWASTGHAPFLTLARDVAVEQLGAAPWTVGIDAEPGPLRLARAGLLDEVFARAGFVAVAAETVDAIFEFASPRGFVDVVRDMSASLSKLLATRDAATSERFWRGVEQHAARHAAADGTLRLSNSVSCVVGTAPGR